MSAYEQILIKAINTFIQFFFYMIKVNWKY